MKNITCKCSNRYQVTASKKEIQIECARQTLRLLPAEKGENITM